MLRSLPTPPPSQPFFSAPFNLFTHRRWMKPADTAQTRLETRTRDLRLDKLTRRRARLDLALHLFKLMASKRRGMSYVAVQTLSKWRNILGTTMKMGRFLHRYPHVFHVFTNPVKKKNLCCKMTTNFSDLVQEELRLVREAEEITVLKLKKLLMMSRYGVLHNHALWLVRKELGLPDDFRVSIIGKYSENFRMIEPDEVGLVCRDEGLAVAEVEKWREREYREKWLSEVETKYAFDINFPTQFKIEKGFRERLKNWQRLSYLKPYEAVGSGIEGIVRQSVDRLDKRAVGIIHEFLSLTVEKMVELQRLVHFRKDFCIEVNLRELLLKHPGIFYISTKAKKQTVYLREAYRKGALVEPNPVYLVRMKMLELIYFGCRNTRQLQKNEYLVEDKHDEADSVHSDRDLSVLDSSNDENALAVVTLGDRQMAQRVDNLVGVDELKRFYLQYSFPPSCVGEAGRMGAPSRREIGHGMLAERALEPILPSEEEFPYTIRLESTITESNGSSSMASVCGGCLALFDAGVPLRCSIAGIAMGLVLDTKEFGGDGTPLILSDITGSEDASGDMDFKVAGNESGITAFQMDIKVEGITLPVMERALFQARKGRKHVLAEMLKSSPPPSMKLSKYAPLIHVMKVKPEKVNLIIGMGGKKIKSIIEECGIEGIEAQEDGVVKITAKDTLSLEKSKTIISNLTMVPTIGDIYRNCEVKSIAPYGVFVEIAPGREGLCHISELSTTWLEKAEDVVKVGDRLDFKLIEINEKGHLRLSRQVLLPDASPKEEIGGKQQAGDSEVNTPESPTEEVVKAALKKKQVTSGKYVPYINKDKEKRSAAVDKAVATEAIKGEI